MTKKEKNIIPFFLIGAVILFSSFKKKKLKGSVYVDQTDAPTGTKQVYSNIGTQVYNRNNALIYTFDTANIGMTVTDDLGGWYSIVLGDTFENGVPGWVYKTDVKTI